MRSILTGLPGVLLVGILAALTLFAAQYINFSATLMALVVGFLVGNSIQLSPGLKVGIGWLESYGLSTAVALLGVQLNLAVLMLINPTSLSVIVIAVLMIFMLTFLLAKLFRVSGVESCLLASGQAICGSAAILAVSKVVNVSDKPTTGMIVAVVNFLGFIGVFVTTWLVSYFFQHDDVASGFLIGNTLQSMGHVVAAGFSVNDEVGQGAVLIKMCRIVFLIPTLLVLIFWTSRSVKQRNQNLQHNQAVASKFNWLKLVPFFIWGFLVLIVLNNLGWIAQDLKLLLIQIGDVLFIIAMVAIGLNIRLQHIWQQGGKLLLLGGVVFMLQIAFTFLVVNFI